MLRQAWTRSTYILLVLKDVGGGSTGAMVVFVLFWGAEVRTGACKTQAEKPQTLGNLGGNNWAPRVSRA